MEFLGIPPDWNSLQVNHINMDQFDPRVCNLEWCTPMYNSQHSTKLMGRNRDDVEMIISQEQVVTICEMLEGGTSTKDISDRMNVSRDLIHKIKSGDRWLQISSKFNIPPTKKSTSGLTDDKVHKICEYLSKCTYSSKEIASILGVTNHQVNDIRSGKSFKRISSAYSLKRYDTKLLTDEDVKKIYLKDKEVGHTMTKKELAELCGVHIEDIDKVRNGTTEYVSEILKDKDNW
ncbi:HNH endonuclease [Shewanella phage vB_SspS_KASIA]|nr:HNH endonuclease [Shewanella phage vB_SspS_KASIA]